MIQKFKAAGPLSGEVRVPGDKSISHRALMIAALAEGTSRIQGLSPGLDVASTAACMRELGASFEPGQAHELIVRGTGKHGLKAPETELDAGNSGTTIRLLSGILAGQRFTSRISGDQYLVRRPMKRVIEPLEMMGAGIESGPGGHPPLTIHGGDLEGITYYLPVPSAQVKSCVLLAGLFAGGAEAYGFSPERDIQVLCPGHRGELGTWSLNLRLEKLLNPADPKKKPEFTYNGATFREGDKVMQIRNNYDTVWKRDDGELGSGVWNGDIGLIERIDRSMRMLTVRFDDRKADYPFENSAELEHAYAVTVHKSQGSEFEAVILPLFDKSPRLNYRNLFYTAVTRAKKLLVIVGAEDAVAYSVQNNRKIGRYTNLRPMLEEILPGAGL